MHVARSRRALHGAAHLIDSDAARSHAGVNFGVAWNFNLVVNGDILQPGGFFANQNGAAALLHGRIADRVPNVFFGVAPEGPAFGDSSMDVDLAVPVPRISTLPEPLLSSTRTGPDIVKVRSKVLSVAEACRVNRENAAAKRAMPGKANLWVRMFA